MWIQLPHRVYCLTSSGLPSTSINYIDDEAAGVWEKRRRHTKAGGSHLFVSLVLSWCDDSVGGGSVRGGRVHGAHRRITNVHNVNSSLYFNPTIIYCIYLSRMCTSYHPYFSEVRLGFIPITGRSIITASDFRQSKHIQINWGPEA